MERREIVGSQKDRMRYLIVIAAMIGAVLEVLDTSITNVALPQMQGNLGATLSEIGWVNTGYIISNVIVLPLTGWLSEKLGRKNYFAVSIILFTVASFMCGTSNSLGGLIFWRVIQGAGGGGLLSTGQVIMIQAFPKAQQGIATAIFGMGVMIGPSLGPVLGGVLTDNFTWPWIFYVNLPFGVLAVILTFLYVPGDANKSYSNAPFDYVGVCLLAVGMGTLQTVLERGQEDDWFQSASITVMAVTAVISLTTFVMWELFFEHPIIDLRILRNRSLAAGSIFGAVLGFGLYSVLFLLPIYLQNLQHFTATETGYILFPSAIVSMLSFMIVGPLSQKIDARILLWIGAICFSMAAFGLSTLTTDSGGAEVYWPLMARGMSLGFLFIPLTVSSLGNLAPDEIGTGSGLINLTRQLGGSIGIALSSTVLTRRITFHRASLVSYVNIGNDTVVTWLANTARHLQSSADISIGAARTGALMQLSGLVDIQSYMLAFNDAYLIIGTAFVIAMPLILLFERPHAGTDMSSAH